MKRVLAVLLALSLVLCLGLAACKKTPAATDETTTAAPDAEQATTEKPADGEEQPADTAFDYDAIPDDQEAADGVYEIAFVTDVGQLKDQSFNQGTWEGVKRFGSENGKTFKYYQPANGSEATDDDRYNAMKAAVDAGAKIVVCAGFLQETALRKAASEFTDVKFVFIDGYQINGDDGAALTNVAPISFKEEQSGYLAGYAAVKEGFTKLGFSGGGGGENPACCRFGYGFVQGAEAAAKEMDAQVEMKFSWLYGSSFSGSPDLQTMLNGWYTSGTEVVFSCGGSMCQSAFEAAGANDAYVIGVDVDQSSQSTTVITSATKGLRESVMDALEKFYADKFDDLKPEGTVLGAAEDAVGLPTATWSLKNFSVEEYNALLASLKDGSVVVDDNYAALDGLESNLTNVALTYIA